MTKIGPPMRPASSMQFAFEPFTKIRGEWSELVEACPDAVFYQRDEWLAALTRAYGFEFKVATLRDGGGHLTAAVVLARGKNPFARKWTSLPCSDFAPPLARDEEARVQLLALLAQSTFARNNRLEIRGCAAPAPWQTVDCFATWHVDLDRPFAAIQRGMNGNFRRQMQRACREGFAIEAGTRVHSLERFYRLMLETRRRLGMPAQPWGFFKAVYESFAPLGGIEVWTAAHRGKDVASMVMLRNGSEVHYKWSARLEPGPQGATHALLGAVFEKYAQHYQSMDLGRTDIRNAGLSRFKRHMGAVQFPLPYSFLPKAPANISPEVLSESQQLLSRVWRRLPLSATRVLGSILYRYIV